MGSCLASLQLKRKFLSEELKMFFSFGAKYLSGVCVGSYLEGIENHDFGAIIAWYVC
jgi:hypothetical protein